MKLILLIILSIFINSCVCDTQEFSELNDIYGTKISLCSDWDSKSGLKLISYIDSTECLPYVFLCLSQFKFATRRNIYSSCIVFALNVAVTLF